MKKSVTILTMVGLIIAVSGPARADVLTFDDITSTTTYTQSIPSGYGGFEWDKWGVIYDGTWAGYMNAPVSGHYSAFNLYADPASVLVVLAGDFPAFDFEGGYFTAAWNTGLNIDVVGYRDGSPVYTTTVTANTLAPTWHSFGYSNIDELVFTSYGGTPYGYTGGGGEHFAMDNFTYTPIPEPASMLVLGGLGAGLAGARKLRRKK